MTVQVFLQGKFVGIEEFLLAPGDGAGQGERLLAGRSNWVTLLSEVLPRALLAELGLARILLGSSGGGQFLLVLPMEMIPQAETLLEAAAEGVTRMSGGRLRLLWASTENLGDWSTVRRRLSEAMQKKRVALEQASSPDAFEPCLPSAGQEEESGYFSGVLGGGLRECPTVGWSPEDPARILLGEGKHTWPVGSVHDAIPLARHAAPDDDSVGPASLEELARHSQGQAIWGVLRGDVDGFAVRLRRLQTIEEHVQLSVMFKQFFAGELEVACSLPDFWRKVTILYSGGDDFAVYGAWDALVLLAREMQRLFHRFCEENLKEFPGPEAKTISMSLSLAPAPDSPFTFVYEEAGRKLEVAKSADKDCLHVFGRTIDWRQLNQASEIKDMMLRMVREFGCSPDFLSALSGFYRDKPAVADSSRPRFDRPWRYHRRLYVYVGGGGDREFQRVRTNLLNEVLGRNPAQVRLRPAGRVAVEWTRLLIEA